MRALKVGDILTLLAVKSSLKEWWLALSLMLRRCDLAGITNQAGVLLMIGFCLTILSGGVN